MTPRRPIASILRRYTELPSALDILRQRRLTLLSPLTWDDKNDRAAMQRYASARENQSVLGLCFSQAAETFHHWKIFAPNSSGVCIEFHKKLLLDLVPKANFRHDKVKYQSPTEFLSGYPSPRDLPFIKGSAYRHEIEYRIVYASETKGLQSISFPIELATIRSIILGPWLPTALVEATTAAFRSIEGCDTIPILHSKVVENENWISYINKET